MSALPQAVTLPRVPVGDWIEDGFDWLIENLSGLFDAINTITEGAVSGLTSALNAPPPLVLLAIFAVVALLVRSWQFGLGTLAAFALVISMDQWESAMETLALVVVATVVAVAIAVPVGILAARSNHVSAAVRPVLDFMQTMPAFVWLVPVVTLFSIGVVAGVMATIIFAVPPGVRLTELGIRQVDAEIVEAGHAFGSSPGRILRGIQIPLAMPTIMAGINQVIMLALSMAVIAGLVGAGGLGGEVTSSIARLDIGLGFEAGLAVVFLAIYLDRLTASVGQGSPGRRRFIPRRRRRPSAGRPANEVAVEKERSRRTPMGLQH
jgi:glycine betaine/proline transport system permease protein